MMDKRLLVTGVSLVLVCASAAALAILPGRTSNAYPPEQPAYETIAPAAAPPENNRAQRDFLYIIKEHAGRVAVFGEDPNHPEMILDTLVRHLPVYDRIQLREGIKVHSIQELEARIEDYTS